MSKRPVARARVVKDVVVPPIRLARLRAMTRVLRSGKPLSAAVRQQIAGALERLYEFLRLTLIVESERHVLGGRQATRMRAVALQMHWLIVHKRARIKAAACVVLPKGTAKDVDTARKMYAKMNAACEFDAMMQKLDPVYMERLAKALPKAKRRGNE